MQKIRTKCGFIAVIGKPNVGKSTLMNLLVGDKISITADKPQTTRHRILGIKTWDNKQIVFIDTPGIHSYQKKALNKLMNKEAKASLAGVDAIILVIDVKNITNEDHKVLQLVEKMEYPIILALNKIDKLAKKEDLLPIIARISKNYNFNTVVPISATKSIQTDKLLMALEEFLPDSPFYFAVGDKTDKNKYYRLAEIIREKLTRKLSQELPYAITVGIEKFEKKENVTVIHAIIWVERSNQKSIVIGKQGQTLKEIGIQSRYDMEKMLDVKVHLELWVKIRSGWTDDESALNTIGFFET